MNEEQYLEALKPYVHHWREAFQADEVLDRTLVCQLLGARDLLIDQLRLELNNHE